MKRDFAITTGKCTNCNDIFGVETVCKDGKVVLVSSSFDVSVRLGELAPNTDLGSYKVGKKTYLVHRPKPVEGAVACGGRINLYGHTVVTEFMPKLPTPTIENGLLCTKTQ